LTAGAALKLPNTLLKFPNFHYRHRENGSKAPFKVAADIPVVGAVPKWHSAAAPADE
jgi:hypothetical protein